MIRASAGADCECWGKGYWKDKQFDGRWENKVGESTKKREEYRMKIGIDQGGKKGKEKLRLRERTVREGGSGMGEKQRVGVLIEQTCRQPDSQEDVCPCAATLWPADT